jgi:hypothetical protein
MRHNLLLPLLIATVVQLNGCGAYRNYDLELQQTTAPLKNGNIEGALSVIEANNPDPEKDLLYYFEKGAVLSAGGDFAQSQTTWRSADDDYRTPGHNPDHWRQVACCNGRSLGQHHQRQAAPLRWLRL